ncbi:MAG: DNA gyrase subunit A, partial [Kiritimatiellae bacterium]|nr:DNA gyrase subunit A [Kiritimatiellia bacterium]
MKYENERLDRINIEDEMQRAYIDYSMSVIVGRALPDVRDGLKPGNRRILYAMKESGWTHSKAFVKCAKVVGAVIGNYHPHGDSAVYDTLVRMAQDFSMRYMFINGQGNFGSIDGDRAAAYRYTECRLMGFAEEMLADIEKRTVDMRPNFDESLQEPTVLPARVPNLLVNGSTGIAVGMATNIPPHNLGEVVDGIIHLIDHPDASVADLCRFVTAPDFPTGGQIRGVNPIREFYETGRGRIKLRGVAEIEENEKDKDRILITEIPYTVNKTSLILKMAALVHEKVLEGISDIRDESGKEGIRIVIELKRNAVPSILLNKIYKHTQLEITFGAIMLAIDHGRPRTMNLKEVMECFITHRFDVVTRRITFDLEKAEARAHILEGFRIAMANMDQVVRIIRESKDREEAQNELIARFGFSEIQAKSILDMRLYQLTGLEQDKVEQEYAEIMKQIDYLRGLLADHQKIYGVIKEDLQDIRTRYADGRRTEVIVDEGEINIEDLIADDPQVITISHTGYIKRVPLVDYRQQRRGGKGVIGMDTKDEDFVEHVYSATAHDTLLCFTDDGRMHMMKVYSIPEGSRASRGKAIVNLLQIGAEQKIAAMIPIREFSEDLHLVMVTEKGVVKKTNLSAYRNVRASGLIGVNIDEGDRLIGVRLTDGSSRLMLTTRNGMTIHFEESQLRDQGRATRGVRGINLAAGDVVES